MKISHRRLNFARNVHFMHFIIGKDTYNYLKIDYKYNKKRGKIYLVPLSCLVTKFVSSLKALWLLIFRVCLQEGQVGVRRQNLLVVNGDGFRL